MLADLKQNLDPSRILLLGLKHYWHYRGKSDVWTWSESFGSPGLHPKFRWLKWLPVDMRRPYYKAIANIDPSKWDQAKREKAMVAGWAVREDFEIMPVCWQLEEERMREECILVREEEAK